MFVLVLIISLLLLGGPICYAWKKGVSDTVLFLMCVGAVSTLSLILLSIGNVFQMLKL